MRRDVTIAKPPRQDNVNCRYWASLPSEAVKSCHLALINEWMPAPRFREDKLRGHDAKETDPPPNCRLS